MIPAGLACELLTTAQMRRADALAVARGGSGAALMERAGRAVAAAAQRRVGAAATIGVFCGPGANGGDGFVAARLLVEAGFDVRLALFGDRAKLGGDAAAAAAKWPHPALAPAGVDLETCDLAIDALFGAGLSRPLAGEALALVERLGAWSRKTGKPIVSVDLPSGCDGDTGATPGVDFEAAATVTFFRLKPGHLLAPARFACGDFELADIGIPADVLDEIAPRAFANVPALWGIAYPWPTRAGHKYDRGHAMVVSGPAYQTGAARLSARSALRVGAGLVTLASPPEALAINASHLTAVMLASCGEPADLTALLADHRINSVVLGPGLGRDRAAALVEAAFASSAPARGFVLDADALTAFAGRPDRLAAFSRGRAGSVVLTPHEGEFDRLFEQRFAGASKLEKTRAAAAATGATTLLKGADTVVASPDGRAAISTLDAPWLATAGSGDVLSGLVAGLLAQGMPAFEAACAAVYLHAASARAFGPGLIAEDLPEALPGAIRGLTLHSKPAVG